MASCDTHKGFEAGCKECRLLHAEYMRGYYHRRKAEGRPLKPGSQPSPAVKRRYAQSPKGRRAERLKQARRRARLRSADVGDVTQEFLEKLLEGPCAYCGGEATEADHVIPIARGGAHSTENLVPSCRSCNASKAHRLWVPAH